MNLRVIAVLLAALFIVTWIYGAYVSLIKKKNKANEAFSSIDIQLKKRYDLIPNILTIAQKFMEHERGLMEDITKLRTQVMNLPDNFESIDRKIALDRQIADKMGQIMVAVESYPQLKSDQAMVTAMQTYNEVEEHIAAARRFYNSAVLELNNTVEIFPSSLVAAMVGVKRQEFFQVEEAETKPVNAAEYLK